MSMSDPYKYMMLILTDDVGEVESQPQYFEKPALRGGGTPKRRSFKRSEVEASIYHDNVKEKLNLQVEALDALA